MTGTAANAACSASAVLFDFDGTLAVLTIDFGEMRARVHELLEERGLRPHDLSARYVLELIDEATTVLDARGDHGQEFHVAAHAAVQDVELRAAEEAELVPGAAETLSWLGSQSVPYGIVTRNCRAAVHSILDRSPAHCPVVLTRDDTPHVKPDTRHLTAALARLDRPAAGALMVGDHPMDMRTAVAAGMRGIGVLTGGSTRHALTEAGATVVLPSVAALRSGQARSAA